MRVNFFVMFPQAEMPGLPLSYISAFRAPDTAGFDNRLSRDFPNITNVDISASIGQVQRVLDQVVRAVEFLFAFTLAAGLVVLFAAVSATREARAREFGLMRAMGASGQLLARVQRTELLGVGALAGLLASLAAMAVGWAHGALCLRVQLEPVALGAAARRRWPARCWRWRRAGGGCARCCAGRSSTRCARRPSRPRGTGDSWHSAPLWLRPGAVPGCAILDA